MTTPNPPSGQALPTGDDTPRHAAPHGIEGAFERFGADLLAEVRAALAPAHIQELATLCREVAAGSRDAAELVAWLGAHGL